MSKTHIDWSNGPVPCVECGVLMRPCKSKAEGLWEGTKRHGCRGACDSCACAYRRAAVKGAVLPEREKRSGKVAPLPRGAAGRACVVHGVERFVVRRDGVALSWVLHPASELTMSEQKVFMRSALAAILRVRGLVVDGKAAEKHVPGSPARLLVRARVRPASEGERAVFARRCRGSVYPVIEVRAA